MTASWRPDVPVRVLASSYKFDIEDNRNPFQPEVGPAKMRFRSTVRADTHSFETHMTPAQFESCLAMYTTDLLNGTLTVLREHPRTKKPNVEFMFKSPPSLNETDGKRYRVGFALIEMP